MKALLIKPGKFPKTIEIEDSLSSLQKAVGGYIEAVYPFEDKVALIVNEEGKLLKLAFNRALKKDDGTVHDAICGDFLVVGLGDESFESLTDDMVEKYEKHFHYPEVLLNINGNFYAIKEDEEF